MTRIKCVAVGDACCDKTCLLLSYCTNVSEGEYIPNVFGPYEANIVVEDQKVDLQIWDTSGEEDDKKLRTVSDPQTDVFVIFFSLVFPTSLTNVEKMWVPEIKEHCPTTPYILVGIQCDLRDSFAEHEEEYRSKGWKRVPASKAEKIKQAVGARAYVECSARTQINLKEIFETTVKVVLHPETPVQRTTKHSKDGRECKVA
jgi:small GTP-binding protein